MSEDQSPTPEEILARAMKALEAIRFHVADFRLCRLQAEQYEKNHPVSDQKVRLKNLSHRLNDAVITGRTACESIETTLKYAGAALKEDQPKPEMRLPGH